MNAYLQKLKLTLLEEICLNWFGTGSGPIKAGGDMFTSQNETHTRQCDFNSLIHVGSEWYLDM